MRKDYNLEKRKWVIGGFIVVVVLIYVARLFQLQVMDSTYKANADSNAFLQKVIYPSRGLIFDRNDSLIVYNQPAYDLMLIPKDVHPFDTVDFCSTLQITRAEFDRRWADMKKGRNYSAYSQQIFIPHLSAQDYGRLQEKLRKHQPRTLSARKRLDRRAYALRREKEVGKIGIDMLPHPANHYFVAIGSDVLAHCKFWLHLAAKLVEERKLHARTAHNLARCRIEPPREQV